MGNPDLSGTMRGATAVEAASGSIVVACVAPTSGRDRGASSMGGGTQVVVVWAVSAAAAAQQCMCLQGVGEGGCRLGFGRQGRVTQLQLAVAVGAVAVVAVIAWAPEPGPTVAGGFSAWRGTCAAQTRATCWLRPGQAQQCHAAAAAASAHWISSFDVFALAAICISSTA